MASPRLSFLYPLIFRSTGASKPRASREAIERVQSKPAPRRYFRSSTSQGLETVTHSHVTPADLPPGLTSQSSAAMRDAVKQQPSTEGQKIRAKPNEAESSQKKEGQATTQRAAPTNGGAGASSKKETASSSGPAQVSSSTAIPAGASTLEAVLQLDSSPSLTAEDPTKPSHMHATQYVHHFDTYTLVRDLQKEGFTEAQSVTLMKAVRGLLALNLDMAEEGLVWKSDVENETYLFRAASSELRTEIQTKRKAETERMRSERAQLQNEVDILNQRLNQELLTLKDDLKEMFNDRKMAVRLEEKAMESSIQELNYKISVVLNSDAKSNIEGLRWVLTRRAAIAIASMAVLILASLRYSSYRMHVHEMELKHAASSASPSSSSSSLSGSSAASGNHGADGSAKANLDHALVDGTSAAGTTARVGDSTELMAELKEGEKVGYVSLG